MEEVIKTYGIEQKIVGSGAHGNKVLYLET